MQIWAHFYSWDYWDLQEKSEEQETIRDLICDFLHFFADRDHFQLGSLSHLLNAKAGGYQELPDWPESAPDPSVRNVEVKDSVCAGRTVLTGPEGAGVLLLQTTRGSSNMQDLPKKRPKALTKKNTLRSITFISLTFLVH